MTGNVAISEVDTCMNVVLSKTEKHVSYGELDGTTQCVSLNTRCRTDRGRYNRIKMYVIIVQMFKKNLNTEKKLIITPTTAHV